MHLVSNVIADKEVGWYKSQIPFDKWNDVCKFGVRTVHPGLRGFEFFFFFCNSDLFII